MQRRHCEERLRRSNPFSLKVDCFASLAMTIRNYQKLATVLVCSTSGGDAKCGPTSARHS